MERNFDFVGESAKILQGDNKYFIYNRTALATGEDEIDLSAKPPVEDPNNTGVYILKILRVRAGVTTLLVLTTDYTYSDGTKKITILSPTAGDIYKSYYSSGTEPTTQFTLNDTDVPALFGDSASIYLYVPATGSPTSSDYIYRLQSVGIDVAFDREDINEIGNSEVVARGIKNSTVTVTLGQFVKGFTVEEALAGQVANFGIIDVEELSTNVTLLVKIFSDKTKGTFKYGFKATGLSPTDFRLGATVDEYLTKDNTLEGEDLTISADASVIGI